jgi:hypothetical protein
MLAGVFVVAALALAGCSGTGNFDVQQTEPFRVQLEGSPQTVTVSDDDAEGREVVVDTCNDPCDDAGDSAVNVKVQVTPTVASACIVKITIKDKTTGEVLEEREVDASSGSASASATMTATSDGNATSATMTTSGDSGTTGSSSGTTLVQNIVVNVKGSHNIVVLTQAIDGTADVQISASHGSGNAVIGGSSGTMTASSSATMTTSSSSGDATSSGTSSMTTTSTGP